ncbi:MAG: glycosyltransferase family 1 protein [Microcystis aeruginosa W13-18]|jgi:hypothetical protein|nr:glycosyltransferase family 1 protein [Microcystis aeruginosa W13-18]
MSYQHPPIYFVIRKIPEKLKKLLSENQALPPVEEFMGSYIYRNTMSTGEASWIVQTFLWMKQAELNVFLVEEPVANAICVAHCDLIRERFFAPNSFVVGIRADRPPLKMCEIEVVQNPKNLRHPNSVYINHWPQFQLLPRDSTRENRLERISFFGKSKYLDTVFQSAAFINDLKDMGVELNVCSHSDKWNNYRETDLVLAVRKSHPLFLDTKPASKLINAWRAGCVALLGQESAFRALGQPGQDYFEVNTPQEVIQIVDHLRQNPEVFETMRQRGKDRSQEFTFEKIQKEWIDLLTGPVTQSFLRWQKGIGANHYACLARRYGQMLEQSVIHKVFWYRVYKNI